MKPEVIATLEKVVGAEALITDPEIIEQKTRNTLGLTRHILGIIYPESVEQVQGMVQAANHHHLALYPFSAAKNIGYGERMPATDGNLLVDMGRMNKILHVDTVLGYADIEPGVTQGQLSDYLLERGIPFYGDATGSGRDSSVLGNSVEGGFGTTPRGNKRKEITCLEGVCGNGELFNTGYFPGNIGPDLAGLFVQSNFGIITRLRMPLNAATEDFRSIMINLHDKSDFAVLFDVLRELRQQGTLTTQIVIGNALDAIPATGAPIPEEYAGKTLTDAEAQAIIGGPLVNYGAAGAVSAVYGSKAEVRAKCKTVKRAVRARLARRADIRFMSTRKLGLLLKVLNSWPLTKIPLITNVTALLCAFQEVHGMMQGIASDHAMISLLGRIREDYGDLRLMWYSSRVSTRSEDVTRFMQVAERCYQQHGFEYPLEMLMVTPNDIIAIQKVEWKKGDEEEKGRALALYDSLSSELRQAGFHPYRLGTQHQARAVHPPERAFALEGLKALFDPNGVISPGRYGIGGTD